MVWLTWRQHRWELIVLVVGAAALSAATLFYAWYAQQLRLGLGVDACVPLPTTNMNCVDLSHEWSRRVGWGRSVIFGFYVVPALVASFLGGPLLARELERGTHRLAWTQGISRRRWAATKLGVALAAVLAAGLILAAAGGQTRPILGVSGHRPWDTFGQEGPAFVSFMVFGLAAGAFFGAWRRRILAGMLFGLLAFGLVRGGVEFGLRPRYEPPLSVPFTMSTVFPAYGATTSDGATTSLVPSDAWTIGGEAIDDAGRGVSQDRVLELLNEFWRGGCGGRRDCDVVSFLATRGVHQRILYQPADRYWRFQATEAAIFLALAAAAAAGTILVLARRDA